MSDEKQFEYATMAIDERIERCATDPELLAACLELGITLVEAERGLVLVRGERSGDYPVAASHGLDAATIWTTAEVSSTVIRTAFEKGEAVLCDNAVMDKRFQESTSVVLSALRSVLCVPLRTRATTVAVIYLDNKFQQGAFTARHLELIKHVASRAAARLGHLGGLSRKNEGGGWMDRFRK